jgi:hypothetical protein
MHVSDVAITTTNEVPTITTHESVHESPCPKALAIGMVSKVHLA